MRQRVLALQIRIHSLIIGEEGQDLIEYGLVAALISVAMVAGIGQVADAVVTMFTNISTSF